MSTNMTGQVPESGASIPLSGVQFYGMEIEAVRQLGAMLYEVETTGAIYRLSSDRLEMQRKIDPATNSINPRLVAQLQFTNPLTSFQLISANSEECIILSSDIEFAFQSDSLFFLSNTGSSSFGYRHTNVINPVPWDKQKANEPYSRMWADGYGGSLHALAYGTVGAISDVQGTDFSLAPDSSMAHMVFPAREFDFERLYGNEARPCDAPIYSLAEFDIFVNHIQSNPNFIADNFLGLVLGLSALAVDEPRRNWLINHADLYDYVHLWRRASLPPNEIDPPAGQATPVATAFYETMEQHYPDKKPPLLQEKYMGINTYSGYNYAAFTDLEKNRLKNYIQEVHDYGLKFLIGVGVYSVWLPDPHKELVIDWLISLKNEYGCDGLYFDNGLYGGDFASDEGAWYETYLFFKRLRKAWGDDLYIMHHNSVDVWDGRSFSGVRAIMVDTYSDATYAGEVGSLARIDNPGDDYLRFYTSGYGMTQAIGHHKRDSGKKGALSEPEKVRVMASNLNGANRAAFSYISATGDDFYNKVWGPFLSFYNERRNTYQNPGLNFSPDVQWRPNWFRPVSNLQVTPTSSTSINVAWDTPNVDTDYTVTILNQSQQYEEWWEGRGNIELVDTPDLPEDRNPEQYIQTKYSSDDKSYTLQRSHSITFDILEAGGTYKLRIRSSNGLPGSQEIIFGYAGIFTL